MITRKQSIVSIAETIETAAKRDYKYDCGTLNYYKSLERMTSGDKVSLNPPTWSRPLMEIIDHPWTDASPPPFFWKKMYFEL